MLLLRVREDRFHEKYQLILSLMAATRLKNVGTGPCVPLCSIPSSFNNICKHLGTEDSSCSASLLYFKCFQVVKHLDCRQVSAAAGLFYHEAVLLE